MNDTNPTPPNHEGPVAHLRSLVQDGVKTIRADIQGLVQDELQEAKQEMSAKAKFLGAGLAATGGGVYFLHLGLLVLSVAAVAGLHEAFAWWLSALIVGGAYVLVGLVAVLVGKKKLQDGRAKPVPTTAIKHAKERANKLTTDLQGVKEDAKTVVSEEVTQVKEKISHVKDQVNIPARAKRQVQDNPKPAVVGTAVVVGLVAALSWWRGRK